MQNQIAILTESGDYQVTETLQEVLRKLGGYPFVQIHRSIIINAHHIRKHSFASITMSNKQSYPVGRSHAADLQAAYDTFLITRFEKERDGLA